MPARRPRPRPAAAPPAAHATPSAPRRGDGAAPRRRAAATAAAPSVGHAILAAALDPIVTIDAFGIVRFASDSVERVLGWKPAELIGRNVNVLMPEPHRSAHDGYLRRYDETGQTGILNRPRRFEAVRKDGTLLPIELSVSRADIPGSHAGDGGTLFVGIVRDMSAIAAAERGQEEERVRTHRLLAEQTAALQAAHLRLSMADRMASIGTLAAGLGHDMNNVLLPVRARLNALRASGRAANISADDLAHVEEIRKSIAYLQQLADGLHFLAMDPERGDSADEGAATDLRAWWAQTGALLSKAVPRHVRVSASLPEGLPEVRVASHGLTQAVLNLVVNAGEAIPAGLKRRQGRVRVWAEADAGGESVRLCVTDNGCGMTEEVRRRAFEVFFTTKPRGLGTGLGLPLVRRVAERAGGSIAIESEPGKGTTVAIRLPAVVAAGQSPSDADKGPAAVVSIADGRAAALVRHMLEASGMRVRGGSSPARADVWVAEPAAVSVVEARGWRADHPGSALVLFGPPDPSTAGDWGPLRPVTIQNRDDFEEVRAAIGRAINGH